MNVYVNPNPELSKLPEAPSWMGRGRLTADTVGNLGRPCVNGQPSPGECRSRFSAGFEAALSFILSPIR